MKMQIVTSYVHKVYGSRQLLVTTYNLNLSSLWSLELQLTTYFNFVSIPVPPSRCNNLKHEDWQENPRGRSMFLGVPSAWLPPPIPSPSHADKNLNSICVVFQYVVRYNVIFMYICSCILHQNVHDIGRLWPGWWFQTFVIFHNIRYNPSHWLIFFKMVKTANQWLCIWVSLDQL